MVGYINDTDVFVRTELGSNELASREDAVIPREARTLLIFFDGQKNYAQIAKLLEQRKLYQNGSSVREYMQILVDLDYVVCKSAKSNLSDGKTAFAKGADREDVVLVNKAADQTVNYALLEKSSVEDGDKKPTKVPTSATESLREIVSSLITKHAEPKPAQMYNKRLAQCQDIRAIFELIQEMQRASSDEFELALYLTALAFKKSKVAKPSLNVVASS